MEQQKAQRWQRSWQRCRRERKTETEKEKEKVGWEETSVRQEAQCTCCFKTWGNTHDSNSIFQLGLLISKQPRTLVRRYHEETALVQLTGVLYKDMWWKQQLLFNHQHWKHQWAPGHYFEVLGMLINESWAGRAPAFHECVSYVLSAAFYCSDASKSTVKAMKLRPCPPVCSLVPRISPGSGCCYDHPDLQRSARLGEIGSWIRPWICRRQEGGNDYPTHNDWITILKWNELDSYYQYNYS